jgi:hypothetical protein
MLAVHGDWVKKETLALDLEVSETVGAGEAGEGGAGGGAGGAAAPSGEAGVPDRAYREELKVNGLPVTVQVWKA